MAYTGIDTNNVTLNSVNSSVVNSITNASQPTVSEDAVGGKLDNQAFMTLLLEELKNQDPTQPMDSEKILSQTSQLATLESADKTNSSLEALAGSLTQTNQFSTIGAIGKLANTGLDSLVYEEGTTTAFELYFPSDIKNGNISIVDTSGNTVRNIALDEGAGGVQRFDWNGMDDTGGTAASGSYLVQANYIDSDGATHETTMGTYPITSVLFENGEAKMKLGSKYFALSDIQEVYQ